MSVRLQLANGKVKDYTTYYANRDVESDSTTYHTECRMIWKDAPPPGAECEHLVCAIRAAEDQANGSRLAVGYILFLIIFIITFSHNHPPDLSIKAILDLYGIFSLIFIYVALFAYKDHRKTLELKEFKDHGTVNGIRAKQL